GRCQAALDFAFVPADEQVRVVGLVGPQGQEGMAEIGRLVGAQVEFPDLGEPGLAGLAALGDDEAIADPRCDHGQYPAEQLYVGVRVYPYDAAVHLWDSPAPDRRKAWHACLPLRTPGAYPQNVGYTPRIGPGHARLSTRGQPAVGPAGRMGAG